MALTLQEVEKAEEQARLQRRMSLATNAENNANNRSADLNQAAHDRFMQRRRNFLERNPNAVSPREYAATMGFERGKDPTGLNKHELDVLRQQGENAIGVEREKAEGLKNQGLSAAEKNLEAAKYGADTNFDIELERQRGMTEREKAIAEGNLSVEKQRGQNAKDLEIERGRTVIDEGELRNEGALKVQQEKGKSDLAVAQVNADAGIAAEQRAHGYRMTEIAAKGAAQRLTDKEFMLVQQMAKKNGISVGEATELYLRSRGRGYGQEQ